MKKEDIINMKPGPELDKLVAEKVMEYEIVYNKGEFMIDDCGVWGNCPEYSTDIAAAFEAIDKMISLGWFVHIHSGFGDFEVFYTNDYDKIIGTNCKTIPETASKASILAVMELEV